MLRPPMDFRLQNTDGPAQYGLLQHENRSVETPNLLFIQTKRYESPPFAEMILTKEKQDSDKFSIQIGRNVFAEQNLEKYTGGPGLSDYIIFPKDLPENFFEWVLQTWDLEEKECTLLTGNKDYDEKHVSKTNKLYIIPSAQQLYQHPERFIEYIASIRETISYDSLIYTPSIADTSNLALFTYMGIDLFDSTKAILAARNNLLLFPAGNLNAKDLKRIHCNCPACATLTNPAELDFGKILLHNYHAMYQEMQLIRTYIQNQDLRRLVELRIGSQPQLITLLRFLNKTSYDYIEKRTSLHNDNTLYATTAESMQRPELLRFQQGVIDRYRKPKSASVLLLLPCSMKKPYSFSQSHRKFHDAIFSSKNPYSIHELILTSPVGLVPRELECVYPASSYDIPVTGYWYEEEKMMIHTLLQKYLAQNTYEKILAHLPEDMISFIKDIVPVASYTEFTGSPNASNSIDQLADLVKKETENMEKVSGKKRWVDHIHSLATYQFTEPLADSLLENTSISGKYPYLKIMDEKKEQLGMTTEKRGFISLTINGAERILQHKKYYVALNSDFTLKGSVFAPGILDADDDIRKGDEVVILQDKTLKAVGVAMMNGEEMKKRYHGEAVKVRHKLS